MTYPRHLQTNEGSRRKERQTKARIVALQQVDVFERKAHQNLPGTVDSQPNWRLNSPLTVTNIASPEPFDRLAPEMAA